MMRGYQFLKDTNNLNKISLLLSEITESKLNIKKSAFSKTIYGAGVESAEIILRQYIINTIADYKLNEELLISIGSNKKVIYPLPIVWQKIIIKYGFKVNKFFSIILWNKFILISLFHGYLNILKISIKILFKKKYNLKKISSSFFFTDLAEANIPKNILETENYNILNWAIKKYKKPGTELSSFEHNVPNIPDLEIDGIAISYNNQMIPKTPSRGKSFQFFLWSISLILVSFLNYIFGFWWNCILINEAISAKLVNLADKSEIAASYLFSNSSYIYRPLWTYEANKKGAEIILYFYSTNCETFKTKNGYSTLLRGYSSMSWSKYYVWDKYQSNFIKRAVGSNANIEIVGPIWYSDKAINFEIPKGINFIAVFDVQPLRSSYYQKLGLSLEYYVPENSIKFLKDISLAIESNDFSMIFKRKRKVGKLLHPEYKFFTDSLSKNEKVVTLDPDIAAIRVIDICSAVISMPFTSTAKIAKEMGKPSVYYDPFGIILKDDRGAHGIPILTGLNELNEWIRTITI